MEKKLLHFFVLITFLSVNLLGTSVNAESTTVVDGSNKSEQNVPVFVRSRFNLRIWSTTDGSTVDHGENQTETTEAPKTTKPSKVKSNPKRIKSTTGTSTVTPTTELSEDSTTDRITKLLTTYTSISTETSLLTTTTTEHSTTVQPIAAAQTTTAADSLELTTQNRLQRKLSSVGCGEMNGDDVPWIAILEHTNPKGGMRKKTLSKGVLIDDRHVLTTISSIHNSYPFWVVTGIRLGDSPTWAFSAGGKEANARKLDVLSIPVKNVFLHEKKDIAVIRLAERVNATEKIRPVCLPTSDRFNYTELYFHICKKEKAEFGRMNSTSKLVAVTSLTQKDCQILFRRHQAELGPKEFCAWDETGDNCTGDLGGPLMVKLNGRYHVVGLSSYALAKEKIDSEGLPGVYVRVGSFQKWIQAVLKTEFDDSR